MNTIAETQATLRLKAPLSGYVMPIERTEAGLLAAGINGAMTLPNGTLHLLVGLNTDQYAAEMRGQLAGLV